MKIKALILAAGMGKRLRSLTEKQPKCLLKVEGKPVLAYQLEALMENGIKEIIIVIGYKGFIVKDFILSSNVFKSLNIKFIENKEYAKSNSSYSFWLAKDEIKDKPYLHFNCDVIFFADLIKRVVESKYDNVIVIDKKIELKDKMEQIILEGDKIVKMDDMRYPGAVGKAAGIAKFSPQNIGWLIERIGKYIAKDDKNQNYYGVIREAVNYRDFYGLDSGEELLFEINTTEDLKKVSTTLNSLNL